MNQITLYIDPSVMTYALQIIVGAVVTIGAVVGVVIRKMKKKVKKTLNIEEKKEIEDEIVEIDSTSNK